MSHFAGGVPLQVTLRDIKILRCENVTALDMSAVTWTYLRTPSTPNSHITYAIIHIIATLMDCSFFARIKHRLSVASVYTLVLRFAFGLTASGLTASGLTASGGASKSRSG
jgi:hypothetical protein